MSSVESRIACHFICEDAEERLEWLLDEGYDPSAILRAACFVRFQPAVSRTLELGVDPDCAFRLAVEHAGVCIVRQLLERGANPNLGKRALSPVIMSPAHFTEFELVAELLRAGAEANVFDDSRMTPMHLAASPLVEESPECLRTLDQYRGDIGARDAAGETPLHRAAQCGSLALVSTLLSLGASSAAADSRGLTPLDHARRHRDLVGGSQIVDVGPTPDWEGTIRALSA